MVVSRESFAPVARLLADPKNWRALALIVSMSWAAREAFDNLSIHNAVTHDDLAPIHAALKAQREALRQCEAQVDDNAARLRTADDLVSDIARSYVGTAARLRVYYRTVPRSVRNRSNQAAHSVRDNYDRKLRHDRTAAILDAIEYAR